MSNVREHQQRVNLTRQTRLYRARLERALNQQRKIDKRENDTFWDGLETDDIEHDAQREYELIDGSAQEQKAVWDKSYHY